MSEKKLSPEEKEWERKEKVKQIEDKYANLPRYQVRNDLSKVERVFSRYIDWCFGALMALMAMLVLEHVQIEKYSNISVRGNMKRDYLCSNNIKLQKLPM